MITSGNVSLDYIKVRNGETLSHGGSQLWFPKDGDLKDLSIHTGGCGLIAIFDFMLWYEERASQAGKRTFSGPAADVRKTGRIPDRSAYMDGIRALFRRYPVLPKLGSSSLLLPVYLNLFLLRNHANLRLSFLFRNTKEKRMRILQGSLEDGYPVILSLGARILPFGKLKGVTFYTYENGRLKPAVTDVRRHFVTVTGIRYPEDITEPVLLEISSWGRKYYINYEELTAYMTKSSLPWLTGFFYVKRARGKAPFGA